MTMPKIIVGCSGSVACIKVHEIIHTLRSSFPGHKIVVVPTKNACHFLPREPNGDIAFSEFSAEKGGQIFVDEGFLLVLNSDVVLTKDSLQSVVPMEDVEALIVSPMGANLMAKLALPAELREKNGSNLEYLIEAFQTFRTKFSLPKPFLIAPAMNQAMWNSPLTKKHLKQLEENYGLNFHVIPTICKASMCGEVGYGCMATPATIVQQLQNALLQLTPVDLAPDIIAIPRRIFDGGPGADFRPEKSGSERSHLTDGLNFESSISVLPYEGCLFRVLGSLGDDLNLLVGMCDGQTTATATVRDVVWKFLKDLEAASETSRDTPLPTPALKIVIGSASNFRLSEDLALLETLPLEIFSDENEWELWKKRSDPVLHIVLRQWASILLVVDPPRDFIQKIVTGICSDLLTCVIRAWDYSKATFVVYTADFIRQSKAEVDNDMNQELAAAGIPIIWEKMSKFRKTAEF